MGAHYHSSFDGQLVAGLTRCHPEMAAEAASNRRWVSYVMVDDVDSVARRSRDAGGG